jgi:phosphatidylserine decarboxylase
MRTLLFSESMEIPILLMTLTLMYPAYCGYWFVVLSTFMYFYRSPRRRITSDPDSIVAPSDGKVLEIVPLADGFTQIKVYLSIFDVHIQWLPVDGYVKTVTYKPGEFNLAHVFEKSDFNERISTIFSTIHGEVQVDQIAGQVARRIVNRCEPGQLVSKGDAMGMIKLSSRVDIFIPTNRVVLCVKPYDVLRGGETQIAKWVT